MNARRSLLIVAIMAAIAAGSYIGYKLKKDKPPTISGPALTVSFLSADLGNGILIKTPEKHYLLIDPGPRQTADELLYMLEQEGVKSASILLTNTSTDRAGSLKQILGALKVSKVYHGETRSWSRLAADLRKKGIAEEYLWEKKSIRISETTRLDVLSPPKGHIKATGDDDNSLVTQLHFGNKSFLFTSDIRIAGEAHLITSGLDVKSSVLCVPRHGRYPGMSLELLREVRPEICEISVGTGSDRPCRDLSDRIATENSGADVCRTDKYGTIDMITDGRSILVQTEKPGNE